MTCAPVFKSNAELNPSLWIITDCLNLNHGFAQLLEFSFTLRYAFLYFWIKNLIYFWYPFLAIRFFHFVCWWLVFVILCRVQAYFPVEVLWFWTVFAIVCVTIGQAICVPFLCLQRRFCWTLLPLISVNFLIMIVTHHHVYPLRSSDSILYNSRILWIDTKWKWRYCIFYYHWLLQESFVSGNITIIRRFFNYYYLYLKLY